MRYWLFVFLFAFSCNAADKKSDSITVTISPLKYFVEQIAGSDFNVNVIVPAGSSPEIYEPTASMMKSASNSAMYVSIGLLECERTIIDALPKSTIAIELYKDVNVIGDVSHEEHGHDEDGNCEHNHGGIDPHIWSSTSGARIIADQITRSLCAINSDSCAKYRANCDAFIAKIDSLDSYIISKLRDSKISTFIIYHPALSYYARDYGLTQVPIEGDGKEPTISSLKDIIKTAEDNNITTIFYQSQFSNASAEVIAKEIGGKTVAIDPLNENWLENMYIITDLLIQSINNE